MEHLSPWIPCRFQNQFFLLEGPHKGEWRHLYLHRYSLKDYISFLKMYLLHLTADPSPLVH